MGIMGNELYIKAMELCSSCDALHCEGCNMRIKMNDKKIVILEGTTKKILKVIDENGNTVADINNELNEWKVMCQTREF